MTQKGEIVLGYPNVGSVRMALALNKAFELGCQSDLVKLCAIFMAMSSTMNSDSEKITVKPHPDGDIMHLLEQF